MSSVNYLENGLNVQYTANFIEKSEADSYLIELKTLPFYSPTLKIRGKPVKPKRQVLAYADDDVSYTFSGFKAETHPWIPLILNLRKKVEEYIGCSYNYVLLNLYPDGSSYISQHKDNENSLHSEFPVAVLSFGETRKIEFKRPKCKSTCIELEHGSLYTMSKPTNDLFTHGISPNPLVKNARISLTFRHIIPSPTAKRPRLDESTETSDLAMTNELPKNDWLDTFYLSANSSDIVLAEWDIGGDSILQIIFQNNKFLRVHIVSFKVLSEVEKYPIWNASATMIPSTWNEFQSKILKFTFSHIKDTFVANNQLIVAFTDRNSCILQQIFKTDVGFSFKPCVLNLSKNQIEKIIELKHEISESLIENFLTKLLPTLIILKRNICYKHMDEKQAIDFFFNCLKNEIIASLNSINDCEGCSNNYPSLFDHECATTPLYDKFLLNRQYALLNLNVSNLLKNLYANCSCHYTNNLFCKYDKKFYESFFENLF